MSCVLTVSSVIFRTGSSLFVQRHSPTAGVAPERWKLRQLSVPSLDTGPVRSCGPCIGHAQLFDQICVFDPCGEVDHLLSIEIDNTETFALLDFECEAMAGLDKMCLRFGVGRRLAGMSLHQGIWVRKHHPDWMSQRFELDGRLLGIFQSASAVLTKRNSQC